MFVDVVNVLFCCVDAPNVCDVSRSSTCGHCYEHFFPMCGLADACVAECSGFVVDWVGTSRGHDHGTLVTSVMMSFVVLLHR